MNEMKVSLRQTWRALKEELLFSNRKYCKFCTVVSLGEHSVRRLSVSHLHLAFALGRREAECRSCDSNPWYDEHLT